MFGSKRKKSGSAGRQSMPEQEAQDIVYAFVDVMAEHADFILDARLLPESKQRLYQAFNQHIMHYETLKNISLPKFQEEGWDETLDQLKVLRRRISDFQTIDPEDESLVAQINSGPNIKELAEQLKEGSVPEQERGDVQAYLRKAMQTFRKYHDRGMTELWT